MLYKIIAKIIRNNVLWNYYRNELIDVYIENPKELSIKQFKTIIEISEYVKNNKIKFNNSETLSINIDSIAEVRYGYRDTYYLTINGVHTSNNYLATIILNIIQLYDNQVIFEIEEFLRNKGKVKFRVLTKRFIKK